jgi:hypothetical protein
MNALVVILLFVCPALAIGEPYVSKSPPSDDAIFKKEATLPKCHKGMNKIVGKLQLSDNSWEIYYLYVEKEGKAYLGRDMRLKRLDTNIWICECGEPEPFGHGVSWGIIDTPK